MSDTINPTNLIANPSMTFAKPANEVDVTAGQRLTVDGSGKGITYVVSGDNTDSGNANAVLTITDPKHFKGTIDIGSFAAVVFQGIAADSYTYSDNTLTLYSGNRVLDKLTVESNGGFAIGGRFNNFVELVTGVIHSGFGGIILPVHT